jgi:hypothetical protein
MEFKKEFIGDLIGKYRQKGLSKVVMFEDRVEHVDRFQRYLR